MTTATASINAVRTAINAESAEHYGASLPVGPFTVECDSPAWTVTGLERFAEAALSLVSLRNNQKHLRWSLLDADGFIVPSSQIKIGLAIMVRDAERIMEAVESYL